MTKLVVVLAVVIVVIVVIVIIAARSMRAEDPAEFADRLGGRGPSRGGQDDRDARYERRERHPRRGSRPSQRQGGSAARPAGASAGRGFDDRREQRRSRGYDQRMQDGRGYETDRDFGPRPGPGYDERRGAQPPGPEERRRGGGRTQHRPEESQAPARASQARGRRSGDSSEWDSSEWEKLSDIDYWAELASDKSLTNTARPAARPAAAPAAQARSGPDRDTEALPVRSPAPSPPPRRDPATGLPVRVPVSGALDHSRPLAAAPSEPRLSRHADPASLPSPGRGIPQGRPPVPPDDDPLTSPSFPRIPASDSRSYRNGRADTPPRGSSVPSPYIAPAQQFPSYGSPAPDFPGNGSRGTDTTYPNAHHPDLLPGRDGYPRSALPAPARPAPSAPAAAGNPYGSYVTPDSPAGLPAGYGDYPGAHSGTPSDGHGSYLPPPPGEARQVTENGYWHGQPSAPGSGTASYPDSPGHFPDPAGPGSQRGDYRNGYGNGYGAPDPAGYQPGSYPAGPGPHEPTGYAPLDPYERDGYGGYPGYGAAGR